MEGEVDFRRPERKWEKGGGLRQAQSKRARGETMLLERRSMTREVVLRVEQTRGVESRKEE